MLTADDYQKLEKYLHEDQLLEKLITKLHTHHLMQMSKISHELRNPLTSLSSYLQLIQSQHPEVIEFKFWDDLINESQYMCKLLNELSICSRSNKINPHVISLQKLIQDCCSHVSLNFCDTSYNIQFSHEGNIPLILGDDIKLCEVFYNLLQNSHEAFDNTINDTEYVYINVKVMDNGFLRISIKDNGTGIPAEIKDSVFLPFFTSKETGNGIGLPLCKNIIEAHKGNIFFESEINVGTTFYIDLPYIN